MIFLALGFFSTLNLSIQIAQYPLNRGVILIVFLFLAITSLIFLAILLHQANKLEKDFKEKEKETTRTLEELSLLQRDVEELRNRIRHIER
ncbi:MAG: hypothetical protein ACOX0P_00745 [Candidatus Dojkabacteria bacterium]